MHFRCRLTRIKHLRVYSQEIAALPDWRITCFFADKAYRGQACRRPHSL
jgi:hypothetical protein